MKTKRFESSEGNVCKYVFDFENAIAEAVLYKYDSFEERTVMCVSVQSGCPIGCKFCGTGKKFIRNLTQEEITYQVHHLVEEAEILGGLESLNNQCKKFQIMFMSMGEPMLNIDNVALAIDILSIIYPNAQLLISTMAPRKLGAFDRLFEISYNNRQVGLQFSVHEAFDRKRDELIPYKNKLNLREIRDVGINWNKMTNRPVYINYCIGENNQTLEEMNRLKDLFSPAVFHLTFSVICSADETMKDAGFRNLEAIYKIQDYFINDGYNVRVFNPAGQDDIGGGCGQLWYVQEWMKAKKPREDRRRSISFWPLI